MKSVIVPDSLRYSEDILSMAITFTKGADTISLRPISYNSKSFYSHNEEQILDLLKDLDNKGNNILKDQTTYIIQVIYLNGETDKSQETMNQFETEVITDQLIILGQVYVVCYCRKPIIKVNPGYEPPPLPPKKRN